MGEENSEMMNLDLNLGPTSPPNTELRSESLMSEAVNLDDLIENRRARSRMRHRWRSLMSPQQVPFEAGNIATEMMVNLRTGEGSAPLEGRNDDVVKACENYGTHVKDEKLGRKEEGEEDSGDEGSFFDCNICLGLSSDPVVTSCGHLFCWPCLYQWLNVHSDSNECPVCKGEVTTKNLTPVYGRGSITHEQDGKTNVKVPDRPPARRVESWRQTIQRNTFPIPMEEMIRRSGSGFDFSRDLVEVQPQTIESLNESPERNRSLLNRILTSRAMRQEQATTTVPPNEAIEIDLTPNTVRGIDVEDRRVASYLRRSHTYRSAPTAELANITQRLIESYIRYTSAERVFQDHPIPADDRDSVSSIAAAIHSESQNLDTTVEINSRVLNSTSSSRRGIDASRVSDVDSDDSRAPRRRRLN